MIIFTLLLACSDTEKGPTVIDIKPKPQQIAKPIKPEPKPEPKPVHVEEKEIPSKPVSSCEERLKEYSDFVDEYVLIMKKTQKGDLSAIQNYAELLEKAEQSGGEIEALYENETINAECWKKYNRINLRMTEAMMDKPMTEEERKQQKELQEAGDKLIDQAACMEKCQSNSDPMAQMTCIQNCM